MRAANVSDYFRVKKSINIEIPTLQMITEKVVLLKSECCW